VQGVAQALICSVTKIYFEEESQVDGERKTDGLQKLAESPSGRAANR